MTLTIAEVFKKINEARFSGDRVFILRKNDSSALRGILKMNYDRSLVLSLPPGIPPYKRKNVPAGFGDTTLLSSARTWYVFSKELAPTLTQSKREFLFITLLEALDPEEADILLQAKDRKLKLNLTAKAINEAFPGLIKNFIEIDETSLNTTEAETNIRETTTNEEVPQKRGRGRPKKSKNFS
jgi:hypothetical protein